MASIASRRQPFAAIVIAAMALFISEKLRYDVIGLLVLAALLVSGILTPAEGLSGFSNEATIVVAAMFALNAGLVSYTQANGTVEVVNLDVVHVLDEDRAGR